MEEREGRNRRGNEETADEYQAEQKTAGIGETAEKAVATIIGTGLKIGEAKEKLVIAKENKKLKTDKKSGNFHRDKRNNRLQADRLTADNNNVQNEDYAENADADGNAAEAESGRQEARETNGQEVKTEPNDKNKKALRRKMRERMREQRQREFPAERYDSADNDNRYYYEETADFDGYADYDDSEEYGGYGESAAEPGEPYTADERTDGKTPDEDKTQDEMPEPANYRHKDDKTKLLNSGNTDKPGKLNSESKPRGLKQDKNEAKLKTGSKVNSDIPTVKDEPKPGKLRLKRRRKRLNNLTEQKHEMKTTRLARASAVSKLITDNPENKDSPKPNPKRLKLKRKQRNSLIEQKYRLKNARLAYASAVSKLITNSGENDGNPSAEREQENLNRNLVNTASTGLKSVIADFESFEANLFPKDKNKELKKGFTRKKQRRERYVRKKTETAAESKRQAETAVPKTNIKADNVSVEVDNALNGADGGVTDYSLNDNGGGEALNRRDSDNARLNTRETGKPLRKNDSGESLNSRESRDSLKRRSKTDGGGTENAVSLNHERQKRKTAESVYKRRKDNGSGKITAADMNNRKGAVTSSNAEAVLTETEPPRDNAGGKPKKPSRLKHDKTRRGRKASPTADTADKLKFSREHPSWHGRRSEKIRLGSNKDRSVDGAAAPLANKKENAQKLAAQKTHNKKAIRKRALKNKQKLAENALRYGKKTGKNAAKQTLEAVKLLVRLVLQKLVAMVLFLIGQILSIGAFLLIPVIIIAVVGVIFFGTAGTMLLTSYLADDVTLTEVTVYYSDKENSLIESLTEDSIKAEYGVDEVNFILVDNIGHNPHYLLSYLTAKYQEFTFSQVRSELDAIFGLQYTKTVTVRTVEVPVTDDDGEPTGETETRTVADVTLTNNGFYDILYSRLTSDEREHFLLLLEMSGNRQYGGFPMSWDWLINITEDFNNQNNGVEAEVPENTAVYGTIEGVIVNAAADSVSIQGAIGEDVIIITFSNLNSVTVDAGDTVEMTTVVGYTSDRIFIQIQRNGVYVNPVLFLQSRRQDLVYGTTLPPLTQSEFNDLTDFASDALGTPYVFGTSNPPDGTDCSGFIWWAYDGGGIKSWGRTTAQGQFNQCDPITLADARPGDLIFFQGTYDTKDSRVVTHVGIYLGNGEMQHSGTPNQITSINTSYWQEHFYSFGRLRR